MPGATVEEGARGQNPEPTNGSSARRSASPVTMQLASRLIAVSRNLRAGSRQTRIRPATAPFGQARRVRQKALPQRLVDIAVEFGRRSRDASSANVSFERRITPPAAGSGREAARSGRSAAGAADQNVVSRTQRSAPSASSSSSRSSVRPRSAELGARRQVRQSLPGRPAQPLVIPTDRTTAAGRPFLVTVTGARSAASRSWPKRALSSMAEIVRKNPQ